jgi:hypothetical protein
LLWVVAVVLATQVLLLLLAGQVAVEVLPLQLLIHFRDKALLVKAMPVESGKSLQVMLAVAVAEREPLD